MSDDTESVPLADLLRDASGILADGDYPGLAQACQLGALKLGGFPSKQGESFVKDVLAVLDKSDRLCVERMNAHANGAIEQTDETAQFVATPRASFDEFAEAVEECRAWGLDPEKRLPNALRQIIESLDAIRTYSEQCASRREFPDDEQNDDPKREDTFKEFASISRACANLLDALGIAQPKLDA